ncbi:MAG: protein translocase subunit SecF [Halobacteria archaeon]|nr:protein translocase subunit SecF [Halobacteria archaeon]
MFSVENVDYTDYTNRQLLAVPAGILLATFVIIGATMALTGTPAHLGQEFTGGVTVQVTTDAPMDQVRSDFSSVATPESVQSTRTGYILSYQPLSEDEMSQLRNVASSYADNSVSQISPTYGASLQTQGISAVVFAFAVMSIIIFAFFRTVVPSLAVVLSAFSDMVVPIGVMNLLGIDLSLATIPALLLLIGYSIDSDILLTRSVLKGRRSEFHENVEKAMETGITMTTTSMAAMFAMAVVSHLASIFVLRDIGVILFVGLGVDIINTYMMNVSLLRWEVVDRRGKASNSRGGA